MGPINFKIAVSEKERLRRRLLYTVTAALLLIVFSAGYLTVYVNSYNILHAEPMEVFGVYDDTDGRWVVILNKPYKLY